MKGLGEEGEAKNGSRNGSSSSSSSWVTGAWSWMVCCLLGCSEPANRLDLTLGVLPSGLNSGPEMKTRDCSEESANSSSSVPCQTKPGLISFHLC